MIKKTCRDLNSHSKFCFLTRKQGKVFMLLRSSLLLSPSAAAVLFVLFYFFCAILLDLSMTAASELLVVLAFVSA